MCVCVCVKKTMSLLLIVYVEQEYFPTYFYIT